MNTLASVKEKEKKRKVNKCEVGHCSLPAQFHPALAGLPPAQKQLMMNMMMEQLRKNSASSGGAPPTSLPNGLPPSHPAANQRPPSALPPTSVAGRLGTMGGLPIGPPPLGGASLTNGTPDAAAQHNAMLHALSGGSHTPNGQATPAALANLAAGLGGG